MKVLYTLALALLLSFGLSAQYCGTSGPMVCSLDSSLTQPGIMDYRNFPCVDRGVAFSSNIQLYFPDTIHYGFFTVMADSVRIDSITNLPCGLCWSSDRASQTYYKLERACIRITGTTTDSAGTYTLGMYGTAFLGGAPFPGSLNAFWSNFYVSVKDSGTACVHAVSNLRTSCGAASPVAPCATRALMHQVGPTPACHTTDSITLAIDSPYRSYMWIYLNDTLYTPSVHLPNDSMGVQLTLMVTDSAGCEGSSVITLMPYPNSNPTLCYFTTDTSLPYRNVILAFEKNNWFHLINYWYLQSNNNIYLDQVDSASPGLLMDTTTTTTYPYYLIRWDTPCGYSSVGPYSYSALVVDTTTALGYPHLTWPLPIPVTFDVVYILSRPAGGAWRTIDSIFSINSTNFTMSYTDMHPDSTRMEYMMAYSTDNICDPSRSAAVKTLFTPAERISVNPALVVAGHTHLGIDQLSGASILVYPNPATETLTISHKGIAAGTAYTLTDLMGREVAQGALSASQTSVSLRDAAAGVYTLRIVGAGAYMMVKK